MVSPPVNPHPFISDVFEQAGVTHLSSAGGTPTLFYPASTTPLAEGEDGGMPTPILSGGAGSPLGAAPLFANEGGSEDAGSTTSNGPTLLTAGGDASHFTTTKVTVVAAAASDGLPPTAGGHLPLRCGAEHLRSATAGDGTRAYFTRGGCIQEQRDPC
jgi:hypothetical protein